MKVCPICQATYDDGVDFCFKEGAPLELQVSDDVQDKAVEHDRSGLTIEDLEPPDAVSLSGLIPVATEEDDLATLTMAADPPPMLEEDELATVTSGVEQLARGNELASAASVEPFEKPEDIDFRNRTGAADGDSGRDVPGAADTHDKMETVHWEGPPRVAAGGESGAGGFLKLIAVIVVALGLVIFFGTQDQSESTDATDSTQAAQTPSQPKAPASPEPVTAAPELGSEGESQDPTESPAEEDAELASEDGAAVEEGSEDPLEEGTEESEEETNSEDTAAESEDAGVESEDGAVVEEEEDSASSEDDRGLSAGERREQARKEAREERRKKREEERRKRLKEERKERREAARAQEEQKEDAPAAPAADPGNPWTSSGSATAPTAAPTTPASNASNPWGVAQPESQPAKASSAMVTVTTKPRAARVKLAGKNRGSSPVKVELPLGTHEVQVSKDGYVSKSTYVKVVDGSPVSVTVTLEALEGVQQESLGTLFISSSPAGALLYVNGASKGRTPISVSIPEGTYTLKLVADGKAPLEKRIKVDFARSKTVRRFIEIP